VCVCVGHPLDRRCVGSEGNRFGLGPSPLRAATAVTGIQTAGGQTPACLVGRYVQNVE
jgi:hypothetical protein